MLRVTIEVVEHGIGDPVPIGELEIINDGTGSKHYGNYRYRLLGAKKGKLHRGAIVGFQRMRRDAWELAWRCLNDWQKEIQK